MTKIPVIDIAPLFGNDMEAKLKIGREIDEVCRGTGFFQITNHGIHDIEKITEKAFDFFRNQTTEQKMAMASRKFNPENKHVYRGYFPASVNGKEGFDIGNPTLDADSELLKFPLNEVCQWPDANVLPDFKADFTDYYYRMTNLARHLLRGFALASGKEENFFDDKLQISDCMSTFRLNHYPFLDKIDAIEIAPDGTKIGIETHTDGSLLTILYQPIEGLQVDDSKGNWIDVKPSKTDFVVNTGELMKRWTNNVYQAANHRVKFINGNRVSVPYFTEPGHNCIIESFTPHKPEEKALFPPINYGAHLATSMKRYKEYQREDTS